MKYWRIRMFWYDHKVSLLTLLGVAVAATFFYLLVSVDCATGGSCTFASGGLADAVLPPRR